MDKLTEWKLEGLSEEEEVITRLFAKLKPKLKYEINSNIMRTFLLRAELEREH